MEDQYIDTLKEKILDTVRRCRNCNYCYPECPVFASTRGFLTNGPSGIMASMFYAINWNLLEGKDGEDLRDIIYACTTCKRCEFRCEQSASATPVVEVIETARKFLLDSMIGPLPQQRKALESIYKYGNPYGELPEKRLAWLGDLKVKLLPQEKAELLYFVGCTASYEPELHNLARSIVKLLKFLEIDFGILQSEVCCGDPAHVLGDEALAQEMMSQNFEKFAASGVKTIITTSPHCFSTFLQNSKNSGSSIAVYHYTDFLARSFEAKKPAFMKELPYTVTYHDPCYLGRHNKIYDAPRNVMKTIPGLKLVEMNKTREESVCCGGGGGRMYSEVEEEKRISDTRLEQALDVHADVIATACPWCNTMLRNSARDLNKEGVIKVRDIAELMTEALNL